MSQPKSLGTLLVINKLKDTLKFKKDNYILNQEIHHQKRNFREEYLALLKKFEIEFKNEYLFEWIE